MPAILISVYNFKGGVGKTTATYNLGYVLQQLGLRVLMVDADPQTNLTALVWPDQFDLAEDDERARIEDFYAEAEAMSSEDLEENHREYRTIGDIFRPIIQNRQPHDLSIGERTKIYPVHDYGRLYLLPGHALIGNLDASIVEGIDARAMLADIPGYISHVFRKVAETHQIDVILFDLNPGLSAFNQAMIMGSDYFLHPCSADFFSVQALQMLRKQLPEKYIQFHFKDLYRRGFGRVDSVPKLLGIFPQRVKTRTLSNTGIERLENSYSHWITRLNQELTNLEDSLRLVTVSPTSAVSMLDAEYESIRCRGVRDFAGIGLSTQASGRPLTDFWYHHRFFQENGESRLFSHQENIRKRSVYYAFLEVINMMVNNISREHREQLPLAFRQNIALTRNVRVDVPDDQIAEILPETPMYELSDDWGEGMQDLNQGLIPLPPFVSYTREDIRDLLQYYKEKNVWGTSVIFAEPVLFLKEDFAVNTEQLSAAISAAVKILNQARLQPKFSSSPTIFIPIDLLGGRIRHRPELESAYSHWTLLMMRFDFEHLAQFEESYLSCLPQVISFFDPLGSSDPTREMPRSIVAAVKRIYYDARSSEVPLICDTHAAVSDREENTGVWVVEWVNSIIGALSPPEPGSQGINHCRQRHHRVLMDIRQCSGDSNAVVSSESVVLADPVLISRISVESLLSKDKVQQTSGLCSSSSSSVSSSSSFFARPKVKQEPETRKRKKRDNSSNASSSEDGGNLSQQKRKK